jgi:DNA ligase-1
MKYWSKCADDGYEGAMVRDPKGKYMYKRSTRGALMKLKVFQDDEATIIGFEEMMHNKNEAKKNALGRTERSTAKAGKVPAGVLGKWECRDLKTGIEFECGTGFTAKQRADFWRDRQVYVGEVIKYKHQPSGALTKPRFPVFLGFRHKDDM